MNASSSTSEIIRRMAAEHGISEAADSIDVLSTKITELNTDSSIDHELELRLLGRLAKRGVIDDTETVRLVGQLHRGE
ncbi:hypothetical protein G6L68_25265 [Agrobacterium fabrum]|uniref:hypothetical protein n=1 Tax=Agrobacterium fabrum TaxID=1176649 RepID=UPI000EF61615|nr:hypothetical protein [Agrobacterium fabrum]AYM66197.1 hypothetical protein At12D13_50450 [Agrobacterium fabrum]NTE63944.1 hypothetical protein [Agrobacterium fabrum]